MHEYGVAKDILDNILEEARKHNARVVKEVVLDVGSLTMLNPEQLLFCLQAVSGDTIAENMKINLNMLPIKIKCGNGHVSEIKDSMGGDVFRFVTALECPVCGERAGVISGRELILKEITAE